MKKERSMTEGISGFTTVAKFGRYKMQCGRIIDHPYGGSHMWEVYDLGATVSACRIGVAYDEPTALAMWSGVVSAAMQGKLIDVDAGLLVDSA